MIPTHCRRFAFVVALLASSAVATRTLAVVVTGGGKATKDCFVGFEVEGTTNPTGTSAAGVKVSQTACDASCTFKVNVCINEAVPGCTAAPVTAIKPNPAAAALPLPTVGGSDHLCGADASIVIPLKKGKKTAKKKFKITGTATGKDKDTLVLRCLPNPSNAGCCATPPCGGTCKNDAGGPDTIKMIVLGQGTDLDNGWTGTSHNFPVIKDASLTFCATNCDNASDPTCDATAPTGAGTVNGETFGPPLPLIAGGVPVCVINRFSGPVNGTGNISTGEMTGTINLLSDVYASDATRVCPRCEGGTCDSGLRRGQPCTVDGSVTVTQSLASNKNFQLSKSCPPQGGLLSTLTIILPVTTGSTVTPGTGGSKPCREKEAQGVPVRDDNCGAAGCGSNNCTGDACATMAPDPSDPTHMVCVDVKGGTSQGCCNDNTAVACYQTRPGSPGIIRTGRPVPPVPLWDTDKTTYPKVSDGLVQVATFCEAATGASNVDTVTGLPGPGAVIFNTKVEWRRDNP